MSNSGILITSGSNRNSSKRKNNSAKRKFRFTCFLKRMFIFFFLSGFILSVFVLAWLYQKYEPVISSYYDNAVSTVGRSSPADFRTEQTSYIYDSRGNLISKLKKEKDVTYVKYDDIPVNVINAVVAIEDRRYWQHHGVDWRSTSKAAYNYLANGGDSSRGGSTITQQLVKNQYLSFEKSIERKAKEIFLALQMEKRYTKEQILEFYLNNINYGNGYYGIKSASDGYFGKPLDTLELEEIAFLCAIPNNPSLYDPFEHIENTTKRRNIILSEMFSQGYISEMEYLKASNSPIHFKKRSKKVYNYETSYAIDCATRILMRWSGFKFRYDFKSQKDFERYRKSYEGAYQDARTALYSGGYKIYTSINSSYQKELQSIIDTELQQFREKDNGVYKMQGACTVIDNDTGKVVAIVGGRKQKFDRILTLNRAYQGYRQPGSTFKPLAVYTPAMEKGYLPETAVIDEKTEDGPANSNGKYDGEVTLRYAVEQSKNAVAWNVFDDIGAQFGLSFVQSMQFSKITPKDYFLSSALGGLTYGVTTVEMAGGYSTLANDGIFREPTCITKILSSNGDSIELGLESCRIYSENSARNMTDILQGVAKNGTAKGLKIGDGMPVACKTGTTNGQTNGWFCAYTPYYSVACYVGCDTPESVDGLWGATYPLDIASGIMNYLCDGKKIIKFPKAVKEKKNVVSPKPSPSPDHMTNLPVQSDLRTKEPEPKKAEEEPEEWEIDKPSQLPEEETGDSLDYETDEPEDDPLPEDTADTKAVGFPTEEPDIVDEYFGGEPESGSSE